MKEWLEDFWTKRGFYPHNSNYMHFWRLGVYPAVFVLLITYFHFFRYEDSRLILSLLCGVGSGLAIGTAKETLDMIQGYTDPNKFWDWLDWIYTVAGGFLTSVIFGGLVLLITLIF